MEGYKQLKNFDRYYISRNGEVFSTFVSRPLKPSKSNTGYLRVVLTDNNGKLHTLYVHRLVAMSWLPYSDETMEVNHKNGIKSDNDLSNLEWVSKQDNADHASYTNLVLKGHKAGRAKLSELDIMHIRNSSSSNEELAKQYNVHRNTISRLRNRVTYK